MKIQVSRENNQMIICKSEKCKPIPFPGMENAASGQAATEGIIDWKDALRSSFCRTIFSLSQIFAFKTTQILYIFTEKILAKRGICLWTFTDQSWKQFKVRRKCLPAEWNLYSSLQKKSYKMKMTCWLWQITSWWMTDTMGKGTLLFNY